MVFVSLQGVLRLEWQGASGFPPSTYLMSAKTDSVTEQNAILAAFTKIYEARSRLGDQEWMRRFRLFIRAFHEFVEALDDNKLGSWTVEAYALEYPGKLRGFSTAFAVGATPPPAGECSAA